MRDRFGRPFPLAIILSTVAAVSLFASLCSAVQPGYRESFPGTSIANWAGGTFPTNPGSGGVNGAGDGFLLISKPTLGNLGAYSEQAPYVGNWMAAGITQVSMWLNDVNADEAIEVHFSIGDPNSFPQNFWQYNPGFIPPSQRWAQFIVTLDSTQFTHIIGTGSFAGALQNVTKIHVRHDKSPFSQSPDEIIGDFGLDDLFLIAPGAAGVDADARTASRPVELAPPAPNPSRGPVALTLRTWNDDPVSLEVVDIGGRAIRHARLASGNPGVRIWTWDGRDDGGQRVAPGVYRVRAFGPAGGTSIPLVRVR